MNAVLGHARGQIRGQIIVRAMYQTLESHLAGRLPYTNRVARKLNPEPLIPLCYLQGKCVPCMRIFLGIALEGEWKVFDTQDHHLQDPECFQSAQIPFLERD